MLENIIAKIWKWRPNIGNPEIPDINEEIIDGWNEENRYMLREKRQGNNCNPKKISEGLFMPSLVFNKRVCKRELERRS